jgi:ankyrin repeat protein
MHGNTPLHEALIYQHFDIADILIKKGAKETITNKDGKTPWQCINSSLK